MVSDEMLVTLTAQWEWNLEKRYPLHPEPPHVFSKRFRRRMEKLIRRASRTPGQEKAIRWGKRTAAALVAAALLTLTVAMAVPELRARFFQMVRDVYAKYSTVWFEKLDEDFVPGEFEECDLEYVPEEFIMVENRVTDFSKQQRFKNEAEGLELRFYQIRIDKSLFDLDTEEVKPERVTIKGNITAWYLDNTSVKEIYWEEGNYAFRVLGHLTKEELIKIAESTNMKKKHEN